MSTYLLAGLSFFDNMSNYNQHKDDYYFNMQLYNQTGNGKYRDLTVQYYNDAVKSEEDMYKFGILALAVNILSNYFCSIYLI